MSTADITDPVLDQFDNGVFSFALRKLITKTPPTKAPWDHTRPPAKDVDVVPPSFGHMPATPKKGFKAIVPGVPIDTSPEDDEEALQFYREQKIRMSLSELINLVEKK